jgi:hypothetical protein
MIIIIHNFSYHNCKLPEDGVLTAKHVGVILMYIYSTYWCICWYHNKKLLVNMHGVNVKVRLCMLHMYFKYTYKLHNTSYTHRKEYFEIINNFRF